MRAGWRNALAVFGAGATVVVDLFAEMGRAWTEVLHSSIDLVLADAQSDDERETREMGEQLGLSDSVIDQVITETRELTAGTSVDWAIARADLAARS